MLTEYQSCFIVKHLVGKRLTLAILRNPCAATGMTVYDKHGQPRLPNKVFFDSKADVSSLTESEVDLFGHPQKKFHTTNKTFRGARVAIIARMRNFPLDLCALPTPTSLHHANLLQRLSLGFLARHPHYEPPWAVPLDMCFDRPIVDPQLTLCDCRV